MLSHCPEKRPTTYGIRARPPLNQYTKNVNVGDKWHFDLPPLRRDSSKTSSVSSSSTGSWEQVWNNHNLVIWCSLSTTNKLAICITVCDICVMSRVSILFINPLNPELNPICYLLALLAHHFLHISRIRVKSLTIRLLMSYIYIWSTYSWCF